MGVQSPGTGGTPALGHLSLALSSLPLFLPTAASQGTPAWGSTVEARGKAAHPGGAGGGGKSLSSPPQRCCHQEMRAGPGALGPPTGPQSEVKLSSPSLRCHMPGKTVLEEGLWGVTESTPPYMEEEHEGMEEDGNWQLARQVCSPPSFLFPEALRGVSWTQVRPPVARGLACPGTRT